MSGSKPSRPPQRKKAFPTADVAKIVADTKAKVAKAEKEATVARLDAIAAILEGAQPYDVMMICASALAGAAPICCDMHQDEFKADFLRILSDFIAMQAEEDATEGDENGDASPHLH